MTAEVLIKFLLHFTIFGVEILKNFPTYLSFTFLPYCFITDD